VVQKSNYPTTVIVQICQHSQRRKRDKKGHPSVYLHSDAERKWKITTQMLSVLLTNLIDFHEFGEGARPFYGHLDDVCGWRHRKVWGSPKPVELEILQRGRPHVSIPNEKGQRETEVARYKRRANFASSLPVFTGGLSIRNGSLWCLGAEGAGVQSMAPQAPQERQGDLTNGFEAKPLGHAALGVWLTWTLSGKKASPYHWILL
jgi:hypothetical protein